MEKKYEKLAKRISESREIVKEIESFGVTEDQKIDIMYYLSLTLQDNKKMKEITNFLKTYKENLSDSNNESIKADKKIIL